MFERQIQPKKRPKRRARPPRTAPAGVPPALISLMAMVKAPHEMDYIGSLLKATELRHEECLQWLISVRAALFDGCLQSCYPAVRLSGCSHGYHNSVSGLSKLTHQPRYQATAILAIIPRSLEIIPKSLEAPSLFHQMLLAARAWQPLARVWTKLDRRFPVAELWTRWLC